MLHTLWSLKGGSGVSVTAAALAVTLGRRAGGVLLVDLCGDQPAVLGLAEPPGPGVLDWLATPDGGVGALERLTIPVTDGIGLLPAGSADRWDAARHLELARVLAAQDRPVVVDAGLLDERRGDLIRSLAAVGTSLLVTRACYLALRRAFGSDVAADGVVLVQEAGRALDRRDVSQALGLAVLASIEADPTIARTVDAGLLARRPHRALERSLRDLARVGAA